MPAAPVIAPPKVTFDTSWSEDGQPVGPNELAMMVDFTAVRAHPEGARIQLLLSARWRQFLPTGTDVTTDFDWLRFSGPSLTDASRDEWLIHHRLTDASIDATFAALAKQRGGTKVDLHVAGTRAWKVTVDSEDSMLVRSPAHIVAIVPPARAPPSWRASSRRTRPLRRRCTRTKRFG